MEQTREPGGSILSLQYSYSVFQSKWIQECGYCELVLELLMAQRASKWPQDQAQITLGQKHK